jgi:hypothetical protein
MDTVRPLRMGAKDNGKRNVSRKRRCLSKKHIVHTGSCSSSYRKHPSGAYMHKDSILLYEEGHRIDMLRVRPGAPWWDYFFGDLTRRDAKVYAKQVLYRRKPLQGPTGL